MMVLVVKLPEGLVDHILISIILILPLHWRGAEPEFESPTRDTIVPHVYLNAVPSLNVVPSTLMCKGRKFMIEDICSSSCRRFGGFNHPKINLLLLFINNALNIIY